MTWLTQVAIIVFGITSVWFLSTKRYTRWGYLFGLIGEPFWLYTGIKHNQWGIVVLALVYTTAFAVGLRNHWGRG